MVKQKFYEELRKIIEENPGISFTELVNKVDFSRGTISKTLTELKENDLIYQDNSRKYNLTKTELTKDSILIVPTILNLPESTGKKFTFFITKLYAFKNLNTIDLHDELKRYCKDYLEGMDEKFENLRFENDKKEFILPQTITRVKNIFLKIKNNFRKEFQELLATTKEPLKILYFLEKSIIEQIKVNIHTKQKVNFTDDVLMALNAKINEFVLDNFLLNPEFMVTVNNIEDFGFKIDFSYDPINFENYFNLDFLTDKEDELQNLKKLILEYNFRNKKDLVKRIEDETESRNLKISKIRDFEKKIKFEFKKKVEPYLKDRKLKMGDTKERKAVHLSEIKDGGNKIRKEIESKEKRVMKLEKAKPADYREVMVDAYFSFKDQIRDSWNSFKIENLYEDYVQKFEKTLQEIGPGRVILQKMSEAIRKPIKKDLDEEIDELEKQGNFFEIIDKIKEYLQNKNLPKSEVVNLHITMSAILCDNLKDYMKALKVVEKGLELDDKEILFYVNKAMILYNQGRIDEALKVINIGLTIDNSNVLLLFKKSVLLRVEGDLRYAQDTVSKAIKLNVNDQYLMENLYELKLWILEEQEKFEEVTKILGKLIDLFPNKIEYHKRKYTYQFENLMKYEEALTTIDQAININSKDIDLYISKSRILCDYLNRYEEALDTVEAGLEIDSQEYKLYINKSVILNNLNEFEEALKAINQAEKIKKYDVNILTHKSYTLSNMSRLDDAYNVNKLALVLEPNDIDLILYHLEFIENLGKIKEGIELVENALEADPDNLDLINALLELWINSGKKKHLNKGVQLVDKVLASGIRNNSLYLDKAMLLFNLDKFDETLKIIDTAIEFDNKFGDYYVIRSSIYAKNSDYQKALEEIDNAISADVDVFQYHASKAMIHYKMKHYEKSIKEIEIAIDLNPDFAESYYLRSEVFFEMEKYNEALSEIDIAIKLAPEEPEYQNFRIQILKKNENVS